MFWLPSPYFPSSPSHPEFARNMQKTLKITQKQEKDRQLKMHLYKKKLILVICPVKMLILC